MTDASPEVPKAERKERFEFPVFKTREELGEYLDEVGYDIDRLGALGDSVSDREKLLMALQEKHPALNGQASALIEHLRLNHQELERKEGWFKSFIKLPGRAMKAAWETIKAHPYITTAVVIALTAAALYYTGAGASAVGWIKSKLLGSMIGEGAAQAQQAAQGAAEAVGEAAGEAGEAAVEAARQATETVGDIIPDILEGAQDIGNIPGSSAGAGGTLPNIPGI